MHSYLYFLAVLWVAACFAKVEIAVEGKHGWAAELPTWRLPTSNWASMLFFSGRPATGYHVWMEVFILSMLHLVYLFVTPSGAVELQVLAFFLFFSIAEDFLWFVFNPAFGIQNFKREKIWWHRKNWWLFAPRDYFLLAVIGSVLYWVSFYA